MGRYEPPLGVWGEAPAAKRFPGHIGAHASAGGSIFRFQIKVKLSSFQGSSVL